MRGEQRTRTIRHAGKVKTLPDKSFGGRCAEALLEQLQGARSRHLEEKYSARMKSSRPEAKSKPFDSPASTCERKECKRKPVNKQKEKGEGGPNQQNRTKMYE